LAAAAPASASVAVTGLLVPAVADANAAVPVHVTTSPPTTPLSVQLVIAAVVVPSNRLLATVTLGVTVRRLMAAVATALVLESA